MVCRRGNDPDKMLLCDECNGGTHMFCMKPKMKTVPEGNWYCKRCVTRLGLENENDKKSKKTQRRKRKFIVDEDNSDASSVMSESKASRGRVGRSKKRLHSIEIEETLEEFVDEDNQDEDLEDDEVTVEQTLEDTDEEYLQSDSEEAEGEKEQTAGSNNQSDIDE